MDEVEDAVGLALGYLAGGGFELTRQYVDADSNTLIEPVTDYVVVGVRIPMDRASTNYLGLLGGAVDQLQIRSVISGTMKTAIPGPPYDGAP